MFSCRRRRLTNSHFVCVSSVCPLFNSWSTLIITLASSHNVACLVLSSYLSSVPIKQMYERRRRLQLIPCRHLDFSATPRSRAEQTNIMRRSYSFRMFFFFRLPWALNCQGNRSNRVSSSGIEVPTNIPPLELTILSSSWILVDNVEELTTLNVQEYLTMKIGLENVQNMHCKKQQTADQVGGKKTWIIVWQRGQFEIYSRD